MQNWAHTSFKTTFDINIRIQSLLLKVWVSPSIEKNKLDEDWVLDSITIRNINGFCLEPLMKTERRILLTRLYLISIKWDLLLNWYPPISKLRLCFVDWLAMLFVFFLLWPDPAVKKLISLFLPAQPGPFEKSPIMCRPSRPVGKVTPHRSAQPSPLEKPPIMCRSGRWKNHFLCSGPARACVDL